MNGKRNGYMKDIHGKKKTPKRPKRSSKSQEDTKVSGHQCRQSVDLHGSKLLISLVPFNLHFHCFQG